METTEQRVSDMLDADQVNGAIFESNNGCRGFSRNVQSLLKERGNRKCVIKAEPQTGNKEARIMTSSARKANMSSCRGAGSRSFLSSPSNC